MLINDLYASTSMSIDFSSELESGLFYVAGYLQKKFDLPTPTVSMPTDSDSASASEFTSLLSRGRLRYPSEDIFQFLRLSYRYFELISSSEERFKYVSYMYFRKLLLFLYSSSLSYFCPHEQSMPLHCKLLI